MLHMAGEENPPIVVLSVIVIEAEGLEAKDANGKLKFLLIFPHITYRKNRSFKILIQ